MYIYFLLIRIAALCGHKKAQALVKGQAETQKKLSSVGRQPSGGRRPIWIHAASVGEFEQARPLIERIKAQNNAPKVVVTFFSPSGYEARKNYPLADEVYYLPFATRRNAKRFIEAVQPEMAIFVKYEFWPAYLKELRKRNIPTYCISAIFRHTQRFFKWYGGASLNLLRCFTHIYVQDEGSRRLLAEHGIHESSVAGDTRFDRVAAIVESVKTANDQSRLTPIEYFTEGGIPVVIGGSTWPEDEELLAQFMENSETLTPKPKLILVPHETDEAHLHFIFNRFKGRFVRYSVVAGEAASSASVQNILRRADVLVIDTIGLLSSIYRFGHVAYIGGGFGAGIHNTIEAAAHGVPVVFGPNYHHFREAQGLIDAGAGKSINGYEALAMALALALEKHEAIGAKAAEYVRSELGATEKIYTEIFGPLH